MKEDPFNNSIAPELQARIVSLILGEASEREREELQELIDKQPELRAFQVKLESMHGLLCEVAKDEFPASDESWRLSTERRNAVLAVIAPETVQQSLPSPGYTTTKKKLIHEFSFGSFVKIAAVFSMVAFLGVLANSKIGVPLIELASSKKEAATEGMGADFAELSTKTREELPAREASETFSKGDNNYFFRDLERSKQESTTVLESQRALSNIRGTLGEVTGGFTTSAGSSLPMSKAEPNSGISLDRFDVSDRLASPSASPDPAVSVPSPAQIEVREPPRRDQIASNFLSKNSHWSIEGYSGSAEERDRRKGASDTKLFYERGAGDKYVPDMSFANKPIDAITPKSKLQPPSSQFNLSRSGAGQLASGDSPSIAAPLPSLRAATSGSQLDGVSKLEGEISANAGIATGKGAKPDAQKESKNSLAERKTLERLSERQVEQTNAPKPVGGVAVLDGDKSNQSQQGRWFGSTVPTAPTASPSLDLSPSQPIASEEKKSDESALETELTEVRKSQSAIATDAKEPFMNHLDLGDRRSLREESRQVPQSSFRTKDSTNDSQPAANRSLSLGQKAIAPVQRIDADFDALPNEKPQILANDTTTSANGNGIAFFDFNTDVRFGYTLGGEMRRPAKPSSIPVGLAELSAENDRFSTFSLHVSDVSFKLAQAALAKGEWPDAGKIRIEEFVNAFDYGDPLPIRDEKIACRVEQAMHPFLQQRNLLRVSMRTSALGRASTTPLRLTLLLDNSGSMERSDRQQTIRRAFATLTEQLQEFDQVTLISFARQPRLLADRVSGAQANKLNQLIESLPSEGGTNIEAALQLAFEKAKEQFTDGAQNRMILLTDGAVNLGDADPESLSKMVTVIRDAGIAFDAAGISADGLNDEVLEALSRKGDGRYYLLDSVEDADEGFSNQIAGGLRPSAKNVKVQVEFNPSRVGQYKLLGFEKHMLNQEDFRNDSVDAAELAAAEAGVAIYQFEAKPNGEGDVGTVFVRFQDLTTGRMIENRWPIPYQADVARPEQAAPSMRIATCAALFAAKLRGEPLGGTVDLSALSEILSSLPSQNLYCQRVQQLQVMINQAQQIHGK